MHKTSKPPYKHTADKAGLALPTDTFMLPCWNDRRGGGGGGGGGGAYSKWW